MTIHPHLDQAETRIVIERHSSPQPIKYKIKYYLYHFYCGRMSVIEKGLKEMEVKETETEILSDLIIFEKNKSFENYILMFELIPENIQEFHKVPLN